jgi:ferrochelatase
MNSMTTRAVYYSTATSKAKGTAIFMMNMGGPGSQQEVRPFLSNLFGDSDLIPLVMQSTLAPLIAWRRTNAIMKQYQEIGGHSPIKMWYLSIIFH